MRFYLFLLIFILLSFESGASWLTYQSDLRNSGISNENGNFPLKTANYSTELYGMDFQPLIEDLDNDGFKEIIIFSRDFLKIFDYELNLIDEKFVGTVLGQPAIFNKMIVFNSMQEINSDYFFAYKFDNSGLYQKFNITLINDARFGGIKCLDFNAESFCIFKDKLNFVNIIDIDSKTISSYSTSAYNETRQTVPAIGDIDNDGNLEAVFWFNEDNDAGYGFLAFDLSNKKVKWTVDNIFSAYPSSYTLRGHPVLVDLNNDNLLEIVASVFRNDVCSYDYCDDTFTELFVYNNSGGKLFSKCEQNPSGNCNDGSSGSGGSSWQGTNPFVLDINNDDVDDVCFIKDKKLYWYFKNATINCYNYSGDLLLDSELSPTVSGAKSAIVADINNDGNKEILTENDIYLKNGTSIFTYNFGDNFVIPVDLNNDGQLDLAWTGNGMTKLYLDESGSVKVYDVLIKPENPSIDDSLSCYWKVNSSDKLIFVNVSWYKNDKIFSNEDNIKCNNATLCKTLNDISASALTENDVWKCSVVAFNDFRKSLPKSDTALIFGKSSVWDDFSKNKLSYDIVPGKGFLTKSATNSLFYPYGTDFQPMVADLDKNGENEIVMFSDGYLTILNKNLEAIAQKQVGNLKGQFDIENMDDDNYIEIAAVVNNSNEDKFSVYEFNGKDIKAETGFDVTSQNGYQNIRCIDFDKDNFSECIFRDYNGVVHSYQINATSQYDDELGINISDSDENAYESRINVVPAFVDFDKDNDLDALFWFKDNFVIVDSNKNVILNVDAGILNSVSAYWPALLGLKFVNLDKAGNYEIALAYRRDYQRGYSFKTDINLSLFDSKGNLIFSRVFDFYNANPCINDNVNCLGHGSELFVYDYNKDGFDDIGIYVEGASSSTYGTFIKFIDRNGVEIAENKIETSIGISEYPEMTLADIDDDNELELISKNRIYNLDGTILYNFSGIETRSPIAVDVNKNGGLDLLFFNSENISLLLDDNIYKADLSIEEKDITFSPINGTSVIVTANVHNKGNLDVENAKVTIINTETLESINGTLNLKGNSNSNFTAMINLREHDKALVQVDYDEEVEEENEDNNFAFKEFMGLPYVYINIGSEQNPQTALLEIKNYLKENLILGYFTDDSGIADIKIYIGKDNALNLLDRADTKYKYGWGYESFAAIDYFDKHYDAPYAGIVGSYTLDGENHIAIYGNSIDGDIAAAKEFIKRQADFLAIHETAFVIDDENIEAIGIYDYLHQPSNQQYYGEDSKEFASVVKNTLNDEMFTTQMKGVATEDGIQLRLKHLIPNRSSTYMEILNITGVPVELPVVLARGLWGNLTTWEVLGGELANEGRDVWLIEITGGPGQDCDSCVDYTFDDLTDKYVPALLNGVLTFTDKDKIQYVGFSNGCRATLSSLEKGKFDSNKVDTFVAVGCPGAFNGTSLFAECLLEHGDEILNYFTMNNISHPTQKQIGQRLAHESWSISCGAILSSALDDEGKISRNLGNFYLNLIQSNQDKQPGSNLTLKQFTIIYGSQGYQFDNTNDYVVPINDELTIFNNIVSPNKKHYHVSYRHNELPDTRQVKKLIKDEIE